MKIRYGFVSNSSSSSFVIDKEGLTKHQIEELTKWIEKCMGYEDTRDESYSDDNNITISKRHFYGSVSYHVGFEELLDRLKIPKENTDWGD